MADHTIPIRGGDVPSTLLLRMAQEAAENRIDTLGICFKRDGFWVGQPLIGDPLEIAAAAQLLIKECLDLIQE